ncbi:ATP-binding protein [Vitiosangium sp. GDMCC 1.1324]|uniref:HAMP domain-containing sensor histidine kinase n=1 Tax=Vitiosangium sp. (strain GDMCC 1.1324) TaxID=2138576 RepID=UPI000D33BFA7|nr:ATP-binding protein [Vitiosangium sp. GDMCC 1.1324]PTL78668.1 two-component sensor histidine kinase [Vitiosangium sp. GDMCC 1.1324]
MSRLGWFIRAKLHRRLFLWFGVSILITGVVVGMVMNLMGGAPWHQEVERVRTFAGNRLAEVWDDPVRREELARAVSRDLNIDVELQDASGVLLLRTGEPCPPHAQLPVPVEREGRRLGTALACYGHTRPRQPWRVPIMLMLAGASLWMAAGWLARRLSRPLDTLMRAAKELGEGKLETRVHLGRHATGEMSVVADAFNEMAARIERQMADQRELLAAVSHELRTPLAHLRVLVELMRDAGGSEQTADQMEREVVELDALVGELLASSRLDFGQVTPRELDGKDLAARALERTGIPAEVLSVEVPEAKLVGDATLLGRALVNLLDNARKHGQGVEALRLLEREGQLAFCVDDRGPGLLPGEETRVFEPFYRKDRGGEAREAGSLGLGLALVQRIARAHDGETFAENRPGGGARVGFTLRREGPLPLKAPPAADRSRA